MTAAGDIKDDLKIPEAGKSQIMTLNNGTQLVGRITEVGDTYVTFKSEIGESTIDISQIMEIKEISQKAMKGGKYWFPNPNKTRLYMAPTGYTLKAGTGYFSDIYLFFPGIAYGLTDNITLAGGMSIFPGVDIGNQLLFINPKIGFSAGENWSIAASALIVRFPDVADIDDIDLDDDPIEIGVFFATGTIGSDDASLTGGLGFGYAEGDISDKPAVLVGGEYRLSRRMAFVSENWVFPEVDQPLVSYGLRFFGESLAVDLAFFNVIDEDAIFPGIPYLDFVWNF